MDSVAGYYITKAREIIRHDVSITPKPHGLFRVSCSCEKFSVDTTSQAQARTVAWSHLVRSASDRS